MAQESINDVTPSQLDDSNNCEWDYVWDPNLCKTTLKLITSKVYTPPVLPSSSKQTNRSRDRYYVCHFDGCNKTFAKEHRHAYKTHLQRHLPDCEKPFQCDYPECTKGFVILRELERHRRSHTGEKPYKCDQCGKGLCTPYHLKKHIKRHIKLSKTKKKLLIKSRLEKASCSSDPNNGNSIDTTTQDSNVEMQEETDESEISSDSGSSDESDSSKPKNKPPTEKKHKCPEEGCGEAFRSPSLLMRHSWMHSGHKPYKCDKCGKGFMRSDYLTKHLKAHLNNPKFRPFKCNHPDCTKRFVKNDELVSHMQTHTQSNKLHKCEKCKKTFRRINFLNKHMQVHKLEGEEKNVPSGEVNAGGIVPSEEISAGVDADKTTDLEGEKKHKCAVEGCGEAFRLPWLLERHTYLHSGHKPLQCYKCGKGFLRPYNLNKHLKAHLKEGKNVSSEEEVSGDDDSDNTSDSESNYILSSLIPTKLSDKIEEEEAHKNEEHHDHEMKELEVKQEKIEDAFFSSIRVLEDLVHDIKEKKVDPYDLKQELDTKTDMEQFRIIEDLLHEIKEENDEPHSVKEEMNTKTDMQQLRIIEDLLNEIKKENVDEIHDVKQEMDTKIDGHQLQMIEDLLRKMKEEKDDPHDLKQESEVEKQTDVHQLGGVLEDLLYEVKEDEDMTVKREPLDKSMDFGSQKSIKNMAEESGTQITSAATPINGNTPTFPNNTDTAELVKTKLYTPIILTSPDQKRRFVCPVEGCSKSYGKSSHIRAHLTWHSGEKPFICDYPSCKKTFTRSDELTRHNRTHTGERPYECAQCTKRFTRSDHLTKHLRVHFKHSKMNIAPLLEVTLKEGSDDDDDELSDAKNGDNSSSSLFPIKTELPIKEEIDTEADDGYHQPYEEEQQQQNELGEIKVEPETITESSLPAFYPKTEPNSMSEAIHQLPFPIESNIIKSESKSSDKRFKCSTVGCDKSFKRQDELKRHSRIHSGVKPFECNQCEKRFLRKDHLNKHIKTHFRVPVIKVAS
ncbi:uncharacterized protein LOC129913372 [Episyrphus balteatus]|uniref:uncharacterized protein LOC129913372 n=1 Tax=Episyrphus balteatus TaxID=286459 RepID=UPI002485D932|nr:uncharacterized protein LOC129913372 [Episyrphus balteatus]